MTKKLAIIILLLSSALGLHAQNNPYDIDDECYKYFQEAEYLVGKDGFTEANDMLLRTALEKEDTKAQTLYYVERLKHQARLMRAKMRKTGGEASRKDDESVMKALEDLKKIARKYNYTQYYYYGYDLVQNYYFNSNRFPKVMELVQEMKQSAHENNEPYGVWMGYRYLVSLYVAQNDYVTAKKYIVQALDMYNETSDPTILRQSPTRLYCDLADTYPIGADSVRVNLDKAWKTAKQHLDSLRCNYMEAKLAAYNRDLPRYEQLRDYCVSDRFITQLSSTAKKMFRNIDAMVYCKPGDNPEVDVTGMTSRLREVKYIANIAESYGFETTAFEVEKILVVFYERVISKSNQSRLTELDATLGNKELNEQVHDQTIKVRRSTRIIVILLIAILLGVLAFSFMHNARLQRANEKVRLADAAKTRFVQNMSHEVRTPLNAIVGFSQLLSLPDGSFPPEEKEEFASHIVNNTKMLTMLLDDILNASAMDTGSYKISYEEGECHYMCQAAISSAEHRLQPGVKLTYEPEDETPYFFRTDPRRVQQIMINLITNACKHTTEGKITVSSSLTETPGFVTFSVTDTGTGVPPEDAEKIFERFTKLNEFVQGTGLGLSICREIATKMGGKVFLDTTHKGKGARFVFTVPVTPPEN